MSRNPPARELEISARLLRPFVRFLAQQHSYPSAEVNDLRGLSLDDRVPISVAYQLLDEAIARTGDVDIGLKAGRLADVGSWGAFEYAIRSASTTADAIDVAARYMRLLGDGMECHVEVEGDRVNVVLMNRCAAPRAAVDFQASVWHSGFLVRHLQKIPNLVWSFPYAAPADTSEYRLTFGEGTRFRFASPFFGYSFDKTYLSSNRETGDPRLHALLKKHAELLLSELPKRTHFKETVRAMLTENAEGSRLSAGAVAARLDVSQRTLSRRLEQEGTSFKDLVDDCRRTIALDHVTRPDFRLPEVVVLLGFSETATFYRAFKRWTGQTPLQYRRAHLAARDAQGARAAASSPESLTPAR